MFCQNNLIILLKTILGGSSINISIQTKNIQESMGFLISSHFKLISYIPSTAGHFMVERYAETLTQHHIQLVFKNTSNK